ncbi:MAG: hypothetical protein BV459_03970 [Thermoplasmata archaeon M11B2D]|nr:MAG: hypothetical protein BV459_03970 [Thermoplasmata archaeon M11B2D]
MLEALEKMKENYPKVISAVVGLITTVLTCVFLIEDRYANAADLEESTQRLEQQIQEKIAPLEQQLQRTNDKTDAIIRYMEADRQTRITVLRMKAQNGTITNEERVELENLLDLH